MDHGKFNDIADSMYFDLCQNNYGRILCILYLGTKSIYIQ